MKSIWKKTMILGVISLLLSISATPLISAESKTTEIEEFSVDCISINEDGSISQETFKLTQAEIETLKEKLNEILEELQTKTNEYEALNFLQDLINLNQYPILSKILNYLLETRVFSKRNLVISQGWGINLNPFKTSQTDIIKPITFWHYAQTSELIMFPSATLILKLNPFEIKTNVGTQFGMMLRFRGIYIHIPQQMPAQSYTFFVGSARHIFAMEIPAFNMPSGFNF